MAKEEMVQCVKCGKEYPELDFIANYYRLKEQGITPLMVYVCDECRRRVTETVKFELTDPGGSIH